MKKDLVLAQSMKKELRQILENNREHNAEQRLPKAPRKVRPESVFLFFRCTCNGKPFQVEFRKPRGLHLYGVHAIYKLSDTISGHAPTDIEYADFKASNFSWHRWACPWCASEEFIKCGRCKTYMCKGRSTLMPFRQTYFRCHDGCGSQGLVEHFFTEVSASTYKKEPRRETRAVVTQKTVQLTITEMQFRIWRDK